jgi:hypothetical protein
VSHRIALRTGDGCAGSTAAAWAVDRAVIDVEIADLLAARDIAHAAVRGHAQERSKLRTRWAGAVEIAAAESIGVAAKTLTAAIKTAAAHRWTISTAEVTSAEIAATKALAAAIEAPLSETTLSNSPTVESTTAETLSATIKSAA